jgi:deoxyadenosine/deoxycytidine kinase
VRRIGQLAVTQTEYADIKKRILSLGYTTIAVEGNIGVGKTSLARLLVRRLGGGLVEERVDDNPFLERFYDDMESYAFQTQLVFLMNRYKQQLSLVQTNLFSDLVVLDYIFARDRIFANVTLSDEELALYERVAEELEAKLVKPDLVIYLQASSNVLFDRILTRGKAYERTLPRPYLDALNDAFNHFFFNYSGGPLLVVNTDAMDFVNDERHFADLVRRISEPVTNTEFYVPSWETT